MSGISTAGKVYSFWSWNDEITESGITEQLTDFANGKFDGVVVHARAGLLVGYLSERWFELFGHTVQTAERLGLDVIIYDEDGWPSGFAGGIVPSKGEEYQLKRLNHGFSREQVPLNRLVGCYRLAPSGDYAQIPFEDSKDGDMFIWYGIDPDYVDLLSEKTVKSFIECTHEEYRKRFSRYFGTVIKGVFTDEPQLNNHLPWSAELARAYYQEYGSDLIAQLWMLTVDKGDYRRFRCEYYTAVRKLLNRSFTAQIGQWCEQNNLLFTGHFGCEDGICGQLGSNAGVMFQYPQMQLAGIDHLGNRIASPLLVKQAASAARQFSNGEVLSETFGCSGWDVELGRLAWIWGRQSALGVTTACCHLSAYSIAGVRKRDYPAFFSHQTPFWQQFARLKGWMNGLGHLMSEGEREVEALIVSPLNTIASLYDGTFDNDRLRSCAAQQRVLLENLLNVQLDVEIGDEGLLAQAGEIRDGRLAVGKCSYSMVFVADCDSLTAPVADLLRRFADCGGIVVFVNRKPCKIDFSVDMGNMFSDCAVIGNRSDLIEKYLCANGINRKFRLLEPYTLATASGFILHTRRINSGLRLHICGNGHKSSEVLIETQGNCGLIKRGIGGEADQPLNSYCSGGKTYCRIDVGVMENIVVDTTDLCSAVDYRAEQIICPVPERIALCSKNSLTLDMARYSVDGVCSPVMPLIHIVPRLYEMAAERKKAITTDIIYSFYVDENVDCSDITLAYEKRGSVAINVNGKPVGKRVGEFIDNCIEEYDISSSVKHGDNTVTVTYRIGGERTAVNEDEIFETQRNRFFFPVEPESIYIRGSFDVQPNDGYTYSGNHYRTGEGFKIVKPTIKRYGELTRQGLWFYRGDAEYVFKFNSRSDKQKTLIRIKNAHNAAICWELNGVSGTMYTMPLVCDMTNAVANGENLLRLRIIGTNRNVLGPHHHIKGSNRFVGVHTFTGVYGFEDFVSPEIHTSSTWNDGYSFVPFECGEVYVEQYSVQEEF